MVRQPVCDGEAFQRYGVNWVQLDAPRHAVLHSVRSMYLLAEHCGFKIKDIVWDSTDLQFWGSEQYALDIPFCNDNSYFCDPERSLFTSAQITNWKKEAAALNRQGRGDQAAFFLALAV